MEAVHYTPEQLNERFSFSGKFQRLAFTLLGVGVVCLIIGIFLSLNPSAPAHGHEAAGADAHGGGHEAHPVTWFTRLIADLLLANMFYFRIAFGAFIALMFTWLGGGGWNTVIKRISEAMSQYIYVAFAVFIVLFFFLGEIYEWVRPEAANDTLIQAKAAYLNQTGFIIRNLFFFALWGGIVYVIRKNSLKEDLEGGLNSFYNKATGIAAFFMVTFALSYTFFSIDWLKSLEPHWFSTIYGVYNFAGTMVTSFTVTYFLIIMLKRNGYLSYVNDSHLHDVGKFMFGFSVFWAYIWVSQFLLIWYSNVPEESIYYIKRMGGNDIGLGGKGFYETYTASSQYLGYSFFFFFNIIANFITPFLVLMTRNAKRTPVIVYPLIFIMLIGHWNDLYQLIMPGAIGQYSPSFGSFMMQLGMALTFGGVFLFVVFRSLAKAALVPKNSPFIEESLHHSTGVV